MRLEHILNIPISIIKQPQIRVGSSTQAEAPVARMSVPEATVGDSTATTGAAGATALKAGSSTVSVSAQAQAAEAASLNPAIRGTSLLMSRMFHNADVNAPLNAVPVATVDSGSVPAVNFLTTTDRAQMATLYDYASKNGIDLAHVDGVVADLSMYRQSGEKSTPGAVYDPQGHRVTYAFAPGDAKVASRILAGSALNETSLDRGFVREVLDPVSTPVHASDLKFLEKALSVLFGAGDTAQGTSGSVPSSSSGVSDTFQPSAAWAPSAASIELKSKDVEFEVAAPDAASASAKGVGQSRQERLASTLDAILGGARPGSAHGGASTGYSHVSGKTSSSPTSLYDFVQARQKS